MGLGFDLVARVNATARDAGMVAAVDQFDNLATHSQYRVPYAITAQYVAQGDAVLDWGCGNGHFSMLLELLGARVTGFSFESSPPCMAGSASFTHVRGDEPSSLREIARILRPGGVFLTFHLPNRLGWVEPAFRAVGISWHFHRRRYDARGIRALWRDAGFEVIALGT